MHKIHPYNKKAMPGFRCGSKKDGPSSCRHASAICFHCSKKRHLQRACRGRQAVKGQPKPRLQFQTLAKPSQGKLQSVKTEQATREEPITLDVKVKGRPLRMELDTGAAVSVIPESLFRSLFLSVALRRASLTLRTYTGEPVKPTGVAFITVQHNGQCQHVPLYVLRHSGPPLLGRNWLQQIKLDWTQVVQGLRNLQHAETASTKPAELQSLLNRYADVFKDELGTIQGEKAKLFFKNTRNHVSLNMERYVRFESSGGRRIV